MISVSHWYVHLSRLLQIVAGVFMLYGRNWARWLLVAWIAFHIVVGALHSVLVPIDACRDLFRYSLLRFPPATRRLTSDAEGVR